MCNVHLDGLHVSCVIPLQWAVVNYTPMLLLNSFFCVPRLCFCRCDYSSLQFCYTEFLWVSALPLILLPWSNCCTLLLYVKCPLWLAKRLWVHVPCAVMNVCFQNWGSSRHQKIHGNGRLHEKRSFQWSRSALGCKSPGLKTLKYAFYIHCFHDLCTNFIPLPFYQHNLA